MTTPTRSQNASTPKAHLSTPNKVMASPRPGTASNSNRPFAHKSPAVKTPASIPGHGYHVSVSSQPASTPLTAMAIHDDLLNLNSPATALIASLGHSGLTPLGGSGDGLGITTHINGTSQNASSAPSNPEAERLHRAHLVADILKSRVSGRGITREGVERTAQLHGLEALWENDVLTVAGNAVDLEITFDDRNRDDVKSASLKLLTSETEDLQTQPNGTTILQENLSPFKVVNGTSQWNDLSNFDSNLQYLGSLDKIKLKGGVTCFAPINDLYSAFQKIWNVEKEKLHPHSPKRHMKQGAIGRPSLDRPPHLGIALDFWCRRQNTTDEPNTDVEHTDIDTDECFTCSISCEAGEPATVLPKNWISDGVLSVQARAESILEPDADALLPDWIDPSSSITETNDESKSGDNDVDMEKSIQSAPSLSDMHFICSLFPKVYLPLNAAAGLNVGVQMLDIHQALAVTYEKALQQEIDGPNHDNVNAVIEERWARTLPVTRPGPGGRPRVHSYGLKSPQNGTFLWCYPVKSLRFTHPRQLATAFPVLRQYALLWSILLSLVEYRASGGEVGQSASRHEEQQKKHNRPLRRSNAPEPNLLRQKSSEHSNDHSTSVQTLPIDVTLDIMSDPSKARIDIIIPIQNTSGQRRRSPFILLSFNVCLGGTIEIKSLRGLGQHGSDNSDFHTRVLQVLTVSEDIGLVVEWLLAQDAKLG